jgi:hypothetical protein
MAVRSDLTGDALAVCRSNLTQRLNHAAGERLLVVILFPANCGSLEREDDEVVVRSDALLSLERRELLVAGERGLVLDDDEEHARCRRRQELGFQGFKTVTHIAVRGAGWTG